MKNNSYYDSSIIQNIRNGGVEPRNAKPVTESPLDEERELREFLGKCAEFPLYVAGIKSHKVTKGFEKCIFYFGIFCVYFIFSLSVVKLFHSENVVVLTGRMQQTVEAMYVVIASPFALYKKNEYLTFVRYMVNFEGAAVPAEASWSEKERKAIKGTAAGLLAYFYFLGAVLYTVPIILVCCYNLPTDASYAYAIALWWPRHIDMATYIILNVFEFGLVCHSISIFLIPIIILLVSSVVLFNEYKKLNYFIDNLEKRIVRTENPKEYLKAEIKSFIRYHHELIRFFGNLRELYNGFVMLTLAFTILELAILCFNFIQSLDSLLLISTGLLLATTIVISFFTCYIGSLISDLNDNIRECLYNLNWIGYDGEMKKVMLIVMCYSHYKLRLKSLIIGEASVEVFSNIMRMSYSYFNFFNVAQDSRMSK